MPIEVSAKFEPLAGDPVEYSNVCERFVYYDEVERKLIMAATDQHLGTVSLRSLTNFTEPRLLDDRSFNYLFRRAGDRRELLPFVRTKLQLHDGETPAVVGLRHLPLVVISKTLIPEG